jgi:hypothetical protein
MRDQPDGAALLATAQQVLREDVLKSLPEEKRLAVLMIANAMGIAERQLSAGDDPVRAELKGLVQLLDNGVENADLLEDVMASACALNRELCALIREGLADSGTKSNRDVIQHMRSVARQTLEESNPKYLGLER